MSSNGKHLYRFGDFSFNAEENVLRRGDKALPLTPKMVEMLRVLLENRGRLLEKDVLMNRVWADSFVEEGNLTFTIRQLRKILEDDARRPTYIETVARRGYRFIAEVEKIPIGQESQNGSRQAFLQNGEFTGDDKPKSKKFPIPVFAAGILLLGALAALSLYLRSTNSDESSSVLSAPFASEKLSTNGKAANAVISPDGKMVVYTNGTGSDKTSVWLRQLESANNVEIIPPSDDIYSGLAFSPDGNFIYFTRRPRGFDGQANVYRVSIFGGVPQKIVNETQGWIGISRDGGKICFVRCFYRDDENCSLWIADAENGANERKITSRPRPVRIADSEFSTDGKTLAFAAGQSENQANEFGLSEIDLTSGAERELTAEKFFNIKNLEWLPDGKGLLVTASKIPNKNFRIWQISTVTGAAMPLTKDSETYSVLSLSTDANSLVSTQVKPDFRLHLLNAKNQTDRRVLTDATTAHIAPDGKIFFSSLMTGNDEIWSVNADGSGQKQLTNDPSDESSPVASPDGNAVFFASNRTGAVHVWRMNADGSNQTQVTNKEGGFPIFVSPDGRWVYFHHGLKRTLWRAATAGGEEQMIFNKDKYLFAFSPDGTRFAFSEKNGEQRILTVMSLADARIVKTFPADGENLRIMEIAWLPDGKGIAYTTSDAAYENDALWIQPLDGGTPQLIAALGNEEIYSLRITPDGKHFAFVQGGWKHDAVLLKGLR